MLNVKLVVSRSLHVHVARVPIALFRYALGTPVRPDSEFCVTKPLRAPVCFQRLPKWQKRPIREVSAEELRVSGCLGESGCRECPCSTLKEGPAAPVETCFPDTHFVVLSRVTRTMSFVLIGTDTLQEPLLSTSTIRLPSGRSRVSFVNCSS